MLVRSTFSRTSTDLTETLLSGAQSTSSTQNQLAIKLDNVIIFDADIAAEDLTATLEQLIRLQQAGYHLFGTYPMIPVQQPTLSDKPHQVEIVDVTDLPEEDFAPSLYEVHERIRAYGIPVFGYNDAKPQNGIENHFYRVFGALACNSDLLNMDGLWICKQPRFGSKFEKDLHVIKFEAFVSGSNLGKTIGHSISGSSTTGGGVTHRLDQKGEIIIGENKFTAHIKYSAEHYPKLSAALDKLDNSFFKRRRTTKQAAPQQLLLLSAESESNDDEVSVSQSAAEKPRKIPGIFNFLLAIWSIAITAIVVTSFVFLPIILACSVTAITAISTYLSARIIANYHSKPVTINSRKLSKSPIIEEADDKQDYESDTPDQNAEILQRLRLARHDADTDEVTIDATTFIDPSQEAPRIEEVKNDVFDDHDHEVRVSNRM